MVSSASASRTGEMPIDLQTGYVVSEVEGQVQHGTVVGLSSQVWRRGAQRAWLGVRNRIQWTGAADAETFALLVHGYWELVHGVGGGFASGKTGAGTWGRVGIGAFADVGTSVDDGGAVPTFDLGIALRVPLIVAATSDIGPVL
jgi:hypothetical protein